MSIGRCAASWAASSATRAPWRCAMRAIASIGHTSPVTFEAPVTETSALRPPSARNSASSASSACAGLAGIARWRTSPRRHGSRFAWCSPVNVSTVVPGGSAPASRLNASVVLRVNSTRSSSRAPTNARTTSRARVYASVLTSEAKPAPRCTLP